MARTLAMLAPIMRWCFVIVLVVAAPPTEEDLSREYSNVSALRSALAILGAGDWSRAANELHAFIDDATTSATTNSSSSTKNLLLATAHANLAVALSRSPLATRFHDNRARAEHARILAHAQESVRLAGREENDVTSLSNRDNLAALLLGYGHLDHARQVWCDTQIRRYWQQAHSKSNFADRGRQPSPSVACTSIMDWRKSGEDDNDGGPLPPVVHVSTADKLWGSSTSRHSNGARLKSLLPDRTQDQLHALLELSYPLLDGTAAAASRGGGLCRLAVATTDKDQPLYRLPCAWSSTRIARGSRIIEHGETRAQCAAGRCATVMQDRSYLLLHRGDQRMALVGGLHDDHGGDDSVSAAALNASTVLRVRSDDLAALRSTPARILSFSLTLAEGTSTGYFDHGDGSTLALLRRRTESTPQDLPLAHFAVHTRMLFSNATCEYLLEEARHLDDDGKNNGWRRDRFGLEGKAIKSEDASLVALGPGAVTHFKTHMAGEVASLVVALFSLNAEAQNSLRISEATLSRFTPGRADGWPMGHTVADFECVIQLSSAPAAGDYFETLRQPISLRPGEVLCWSGKALVRHGVAPPSRATGTSRMMLSVLFVMDRTSAATSSSSESRLVARDAAAQLSRRRKLRAALHAWLSCSGGDLRLRSADCPGHPCSTTTTVAATATPADGVGQQLLNATCLTEALELWPLDPRLPPSLNLALAQLARRAGDLQSGIEFASTAVQQDPQSPEARRNLGMLLFQAFRIDDARPHLASAMAMHHHSHPRQVDNATSSLEGKLRERLPRADDTRRKSAAALLEYLGRYKYFPFADDDEHDSCSPTLLVGDLDFKSGAAAGGACMREDLAAVHKKVFTHTESERLWRTAEETAAARIEGGSGEHDAWQTTRHETVQTTDLAVESLPGETVSWFNCKLRRLIFPMVARYFDADLASLRVFDAFVVKYTAGSQDFLKPHRDRSDFSATILLNSPRSFSGGGTVLRRSGETVHLDQGSMLLHRGSVRHSFTRILSGRRYALVIFMVQDQGFIVSSSTVGTTPPPSEGSHCLLGSINDRAALEHHHVLGEALGEPKFQKLFAWGRFHGASLTNVIIKRGKHGRGIVVHGSTALRNDDLITVPAHLVISVGTAKIFSGLKDVLKFAQPELLQLGANDLFQLALVVEFERHQPSSHWGPYLATLEPVGSPILWSDSARRQNLGNTILIDLVQGWKQQASLVFQRLFGDKDKPGFLIGRFPDLFGGGGQHLERRSRHTLASWLDSVSQVWARSFGLSGFATQSKSLFVDRPPVQTSSGSDGAMRGAGLVPLADLVNHDPSERNNYISDGASFRMRASHELKPGDELRINYGPRTQCETFLFWGFVLPRPQQNPHDVVRWDIAVRRNPAWSKTPAGARRINMLLRQALAANQLEASAAPTLDARRAGIAVNATAAGDAPQAATNGGGARFIVPGKVVAIVRDLLALGNAELGPRRGAVPRVVAATRAAFDLIERAVDRILVHLSDATSRAHLPTGGGLGFPAAGSRLDERGAQLAAQAGQIQRDMFDDVSASLVALRRRIEAAGMDSASATDVTIDQAFRCPLTGFRKPSQQRPPVLLEFRVVIDAAYLGQGVGGGESLWRQRASQDQGASSRQPDFLSLA